jgi:hypothetical protein
VSDNVSVEMSSDDGKPRARAKGQVSKSRQLPFTGQQDSHATATTAARPGTLSYLSEEAKGDEALDGNAAAAHINQWTAILAKGDHALERALSKERRRINRSPIVFAIMETNSNKVQIAHGFEAIVLGTDYEDDNDEEVGFFIGDRITINIDGVAIQQDPPFLTIANFVELSAQFHGKPATAAACARATKQLLPGDSKARMVDVSKLLPLPRIWWSFFLTKECTTTKSYRWFTSVTRNWTSTSAKAAANTARQWSSAACTQGTDSATTSGVAISVQTGRRDAQTAQWASYSINQYLPRPKQRPSSQQPAMVAQLVSPTTPDHSATLHQAMVLAQDVIRSAVERTDWERNVPKCLPETLLCRLLRLSGLGWDEQVLLAPMWLAMHQQPDTASKAMVLRTFFKDLGKQVPAFSQFRNSTLFDHIGNHKFEPGAGYELCHHGISLLAISMRSFLAQERERQDDEDFDMATNKTPEAVRKHSSKAPPPLPTTIAELLQLMWRMIVLTTGLFTTHYSLAIQLKDLYTAIQEREQTLMGDPTEVAELIPQLAWAITMAARDFYGTISTRGDVDPPDNDAPKIATAQLSIHTTMFKAGYRLNLHNLPDQWRCKTPAVTPPQRNDRSNEKSSAGGGGQNRKHGNNPFQPQDGTKAAAGTNLNPPTAFTGSELKKLKEKLQDVLTLTDIVMEAGVRGGPLRLDTAGFPNNACLNWVCMGSCKRANCHMNHPTSVGEEAALAVYKQIEPGIKRLLETNKRPKQK